MQSPPRARIPPALALAAILSALLIGGACLAWLAWQFAMLPPLMALAIRVAVFVLPIGGAIEAGVIAWRRWARIDMIRADKITQLEKARTQVAPLATSFSYHNAPRVEGAAAQDAAPLALPAPVPAVPTFAELLDSGKIGPGQPLILAYDAERAEPIRGSWEHLYSAGVGGMTGSGKSWLVAFLAGQSAAAGARIILVDPHAGDPQSLANRLAPLSASFMCDVASTTTQIESALKLAADKLTRRTQGKGGTWPILLICDEWTSMLRGKVGDLLTATALDYAEQGRKFGCFAILAAQAWQIDAAGPVRDRLASHYAMRTRGDQFRYQLGLRGSAPLDTLFLKPGEAYLLNTRGELAKVVIPMMTDGDLSRIATLIDRPAAVSNPPLGFHPGSKTITPSAHAGAGMEPEWSRNGAGSTASGRHGAGSPESALVLQLFQAGNDLPAIVKELRGVTSKQSGSRYQAALIEITALLREATS